MGQTTLGRVRDILRTVDGILAQPGHSAKFVKDEAWTRGTMLEQIAIDNQIEDRHKLSSLPDQTIVEGSGFLRFDRYISWLNNHPEKKWPDLVI